MKTPGERKALARIAKQASKNARSFKQALKQAGIRVPTSADSTPVDPAAIRAAIRRAAVEKEVEKRVAAHGPDRWLRQADVEKLTGFGRTTLWKLRREDPSFPKPHLPTGGRAIRYRESDVRRWMAERRVSGEDEA